MPGARSTGTFPPSRHRPSSIALHTGDGTGIRPIRGYETLSPRFAKNPGRQNAQVLQGAFSGAFAIEIWFGSRAMRARGCRSFGARQGSLSGPVRRCEPGPLLFLFGVFGVAYIPPKHTPCRTTRATPRGCVDGRLRAGCAGVPCASGSTCGVLPLRAGAGVPVQLRCRDQVQGRGQDREW